MSIFIIKKIDFNHEVFENDNVLLRIVKKHNDYIELINEIKIAKEYISMSEGLGAIKTTKEMNSFNLFFPNAVVAESKVREALTAAATILYAKSFTGNTGRMSLINKIDKIFGEESIERTIHSEIMNWRHYYYAHQDKSKNKTNSKEFTITTKQLADGTLEIQPYNPSSYDNSHDCIFIKKCNFNLAANKLLDFLDRESSSKSEKIYSELVRNIEYTEHISNLR